MSFIFKDESKPKVLPPEGTYAGRCCDFILRGYENTSYGPKDRCQFEFVTPHRDPNYGGLLTVTSRPFTVTFSKKGSLRQFLEQWRGRKYPEDIAKKGVDAEKCIGLPCLFTISHNEYDGRTYANIESIMPIPDGMEAPTIPDDYTRVMDRDGGWDIRSPNSKASENAPDTSGDGYHAEASVASSTGDASAFPDDDLPF